MLKAPPFVLVHGAFRGGWHLARLRSQLLARGYLALSPSLPGAGELSSLCTSPVDLNVCADSVARLIELEDLNQVVLVGHSQGGLVVQAISQRVPERLSRLVFLDAPEARHGERALDLVPPSLDGCRSPASELRADALVPPRPVTPSPELSATDAAFLNARLTASPAGVAFTRLSLTDPRAAALPRNRLYFRQSPDFLPCAHTRARCDEEGLPYEWLDGGHDAPFTRAAEVCKALLRVTRGQTQAERTSVRPNSRPEP